jgi:hypothetical protein
MEKKHGKEVKIALVALFGLFVLFVGMNFLKGLNIFSKGDVYYISFQDVTGLASSSPIYADGYPVGTVRSIDYDYTHEGKTKVTIDPARKTFKSTESENFGEGYQWWTKKPKVDGSGNPVTDGAGNPIMEDVMIHEEVAMPVSIDGKILPGAGRQNNGSRADSIIFYVVYKNDPWVPGDGYTKYKVSGIRYSGLEEND